MSDLYNQRRMAASIIGCGLNRLWLDPEKSTEIKGAITRVDIRGLISEGVIKAHQKKGVSRGRAREKIAKRSYGHCKGPGRRRGAKGARNPSKTIWIHKIRAIRRTLRELREAETIDRHTYRRLYRRSAGGQFRSIAHLKAHIEGAASGRA